ncbi:MAG: hypothetical protein M0R03_08805 [Novosphingobium sp.]|nr:hypothetical protein [Novosphingobium sp.]
MLNPNTKITKSKGIDLPLMYIYTAGFMAGEVQEQCLEWRKKIIKHFKYYKKENETQWTSYPVVILDAYNGPEMDTIDAKGLTSNIPPNAIRDGDYLSVKKSDLLIINLDNYGCDRFSWGTPTEMAWAIDLWHQPTIVICPKHLSAMLKHPFIQRASWVVESVDEMIEKKCVNYFYKRMAGVVYE